MSNLIQVGYLISAALFILGLKGLARPRTAVRGNQLGATGMLLAVLVTLTDQQIVSYWVLAVGLVIGGLVGLVLATRVQMTGMPQLVALFNGFGGLASVLVGAATFAVAMDVDSHTTESSAATAATLAIGGLTFTGSLIAFAKLQEIMPGGPQAGAPIRLFNIMIGTVLVALAVGMVLNPGFFWLWAIIGIAFVAGVTLVVPIGGADMPVVIALLNSFSGLAASTAGFILDNSLLIIAGALVGASGLLLTQVMCVAMNRTLLNVLFGSITSGGAVEDADEVYEGKVTSSSADEVAMLLETAQRVVIVPGYGMAVAQAQHAVRDLTRSLEAQGTDVAFAIHPVAGRMPGHMNVLLAEAE
ncbi:MAG: NAD(P)(+) transhydrogenase (Re/Si-specific) subunit beta, partial [Actinomycetota bacterium]